MNRAPSFRYTNKLKGNPTLSFVVLSEMDFKSTRPVGANAKYIQQSSIPEFTTQVKTNLTEGIETGFTAGYKSIMPRNVNMNGVKTNEKLGRFYFNSVE